MRVNASKKLRIMLAGAAISCLATATHAATLDDFYALWVARNATCDPQGEQQAIEIRDNYFATGWGGECTSVKMRLNKQSLILKAQCPMEEEGSFLFSMTGKLVGKDSLEVSYYDPDTEEQRTAEVYQRCK